MYCNICSQFRPIPTCTESLIIGDTNLASTDVYVYLKNLSTDYLKRFSATTSLYGILTLDLTDFKGTPNHDYELWATLQSATNIDERIDIDVDGVSYDCFGFTFENVFSDENVLAEYATQTLKLK